MNEEQIIKKVEKTLPAYQKDNLAVKAIIKITLDSLSKNLDRFTRKDLPKPKKGYHSIQFQNGWMAAMENVRLYMGTSNIKHSHYVPLKL